MQEHIDVNHDIGPNSKTGEYVLDNYRYTREPRSTPNYQNQVKQETLNLAEYFGIIYAVDGKEKPSTIIQIVNRTGLSQYLVSHHAEILINGGFVAKGTSAGGHKTLGSIDLSSRVKEEHRKLVEKGEAVVEDGNLTSEARKIAILSGFSDYIGRYYVKHI